MIISGFLYCVFGICCCRRLDIKRRLKWEEDIVDWEEEVRELDILEESARIKKKKKAQKKRERETL
jgi:hypothetical protein